MDWPYGLSSLLPIELPHNVTQIELSEKMYSVEVKCKELTELLKKDTESAFVLVKEDIDLIRKHEERLDERIDNCSKLILELFLIDKNSMKPIGNSLRRLHSADQLTALGVIS